MAFAGLGVMVVGAVLLGIATAMHHPGFTPIGFLVMLLAAFVPGAGWRSLGNALLAYAFAARIPVVIVMYLAMIGNGGQGWGTHYDAGPPNFQFPSIAAKFFFTAVAPQFGLWIGWTVVAGAIFGIIAIAIAGKGKQTAPAAV